MTVRIRLFARLRDIAGKGELQQQVPQGATVRTIWDSLTCEFPDLKDYQASISTAVNAEYSRMDSPVNEGDEVAFLPPVSGG